MKRSLLRKVEFPSYSVLESSCELFGVVYKNFPSVPHLHLQQLKWIEWKSWAGENDRFPYSTFYSGVIVVACEDFPFLVQSYRQISVYSLTDFPSSNDDTCNEQIIFL